MVHCSGELKNYRERHTNPILVGKPKIKRQDENHISQ